MVSTNKNSYFGGEMLESVLSICDRRKYALGSVISLYKTFLCLNPFCMPLHQEKMRAFTSLFRFAMKVHWNLIQVKLC